MTMQAEDWYLEVSKWRQKCEALEQERDEAHAAIRAVKAAGQKFVEVDHVDEDGNVTPAYNAAYREWYQVLADNAPAIRRASETA